MPRFEILENGRIIEIHQRRIVLTLACLMWTTVQDFERCQWFWGTKFQINLMQLFMSIILWSSKCTFHIWKKQKHGKNTSPIVSICWVSWQLSPSKRNLNSSGAQLWQPSSVRTTWERSDLTNWRVLPSFLAAMASKSSNRCGHS